MPFEHLDEIVRISNAGNLSELFNLSFGAGQDIGNTFELISRMLRQSRPMQRCLSILLRDPASRRLIECREPMQPHDLNSLLQLPKGTLGRTLGKIA